MTEERRGGEEGEKRQIDHSRLNGLRPCGPQVLCCRCWSANRSVEPESVRLKMEASPNVQAYSHSPSDAHAYSHGGLKEKEVTQKKSGNSGVPERQRRDLERRFKGSAAVAWLLGGINMPALMLHSASQVNMCSTNVLRLRPYVGVNSPLEFIKRRAARGK